MSTSVVMYTSGHCPFCVRAEKLLQTRGVTEIKKLNIDDDDKLRDEMMEKTSRRTVPQIFIGDTHVGGCDDLIALDRAGGLIPLLSGQSGSI